VEGLEWVDLRLVGVTVSHFPQSRTLAADEGDEDPTPSSRGIGCSSAGYDPAYLLPFCCQVHTCLGSRSHCAKKSDPSNVSYLFVIR